MSEIQRSDAHGADAASGADRDAKIEQLLLTGLDHYFAAQYEQAINVWTRALFFDRNHPRARAYIERARSALAERQRQSEEMLQNGVEAFHRGEGDEARRLLQAAIEGGAPAEEALAVLERLNRLETAAAIDVPVRSRPQSASSQTEQIARTPRSRLGLVAASLATVCVVALGGLAAASSNRVRWRSLLQLSDPAPDASPIAQDVPQSLPLPRRGEIALARARMLAAGGHLHQALGALDAVRATDPQKNEADELRGDIQRRLLDLTALPGTPGGQDASARRAP
jgi:hypothetical protein